MFTPLGLGIRGLDVPAAVASHPLNARERMLKDEIDKLVEQLKQRDNADWSWGVTKTKTTRHDDDDNDDDDDDDADDDGNGNCGGSLLGMRALGALSDAALLNGIVGLVPEL
jgi:hypothetical protein